MTTFWLNFHVGYACQQSGVCCSSGWPIPVEGDRVIPIRTLTRREDDAWLITAADAPPEIAGTLALQAGGHCVFHGEAGCGIYTSRPASCAHFPYVCLIDPRGVHVTLSHYCPTAAAMLVAHDGPIAIVEGPPPVAGLEVPEGLDARESLPPTFAEATVGKPQATKLRLMGWDEFADWERAEVGKPPAEPPMAEALTLFECARRAVPEPWSWAEAPAELERTWPSLVAPSWVRFAAVAHRYRAAKVFASWAAYTDGGLAAVLRSAEIADAVLRVEVARQCAAAGRVLDVELLTAAIRQSDLLLVHYADAWVLSSGTTP